MATLPLAGGAVSYTISNFHGSYDLNTQESHIPWNYRYMEQAVNNWIVDEYNKTKNADAPLAAKKTIKYKLNSDPIAEGTIKTLATENVDTSSGLLALPDGLIRATEDNEKYYHLIGAVESYKVDAFISNTSPLLFYSINGSRTYSFDVSPSSTTSEISLAEVGIESPLQLVITVDAPDTFPKNFLFMEKAVRQWLTDEYNNIQRLRAENKYEDGVHQQNRGDRN